MCYDVQAKLKSQLKRAKANNNHASIIELTEKLERFIEKPAFKESAETKRCILPIDGFFEHYHFNSKTFTYFIQSQDGEPINIAGLYSEWVPPESNKAIITFSVITQPANELMSTIHNNPKIPTPRMPLILSEEDTESWLNDSANAIIEELLVKESTAQLKAHTVQKLKGNTESVTSEIYYPEL